MKLRKLLFFLSVLLLTACKEEVKPDLIRIGEADFSTHNFAEQAVVFLDGEWAFYWNELLPPAQIASNTHAPQYLSVPNSWRNYDENEQSFPIYGYATYHLKVKLPPDAPPLTFSSQFIASSCKIYIDDELLLENGKVSKIATNSPYNAMPIHIVLPPVKDSFSITIQVSNFKTNRSGVLYHSTLGETQMMHTSRQREIFYELSFWGGTLFLGLFMISCYFVFKMGQSMIYLGISFICLGYWKASSHMKIFNLFFPNYDWEWSIRLEFFALIFLLFFMILSVRSFYPKDSPRILGNILQTIQFIFGVAVLFVPITWVFPMISWHLFVVMASIIYTSIVIVNAVKNKRENIWFISIAFGAAMLNAVLYIIMDFFFQYGDRTFFSLEFLFLGALLLMVLYQQFSKLIQLNKKANAAIEAKERFLSIISHEMRTPMNGILVVSDLLEKTPLNTEQQNYIDSLQASGRSLITLIEDLLDNTRIREGKLQIQQDEFNIHALCQQTIEVFRLLSGKENVQLNLDIDSNVPKQIIGDSIRIKQVLDNLVRNALKFTEQGRVDILVSATPMEKERVSVKFQVRDTGIGIAKSEQAEIFEQFSQTNSNLNRKYGGMGLGLSICKQLVEMMDGNIAVESEKGKGATFSFDLPLIAHKGQISEPTKSPVVIPSTTEAEKTLRILIVEDNPINLKLLSAGLKKLGYTSDSAVNGRLGVEATQKQTYDLIFMDVQMPEMDGLEATRIIKEATNSPYIIVLTANAFPEDKAAAYAAGADDFLAKPFKLDMIDKLLKELKERVLSPK